MIDKSKRAKLLIQALRGLGKEEFSPKNSTLVILGELQEGGPEKKHPPKETKTTNKELLEQISAIFKEAEPSKKDK